MAITLNLSYEAETQLQRRAQQMGMSLAALIEQILEDEIRGTLPNVPSRGGESSPESVRITLERGMLRVEGTPVLTDAQTRRESLYGD